METDKPVKRNGEIPESFLEVMLSHDGDIYVLVKGQNKKGIIEESQVEFCASNGGGYHPKTLEALYNLAEAMEKDNHDPISPERYNK